jgi:hypothetical protein
MNFEFLENPFIGGLCTGAIISFLFFLDNSLSKNKNKTKFKKNDFFKIFLYSFGISSLLIYILLSNNDQTGGNLLSQGVKKIKDQTIFTDIPDF